MTLSNGTELYFYRSLHNCEYQGVNGYLCIDFEEDDLLFGSYGETFNSNLYVSLLYCESLCNSTVE